MSDGVIAFVAGVVIVGLFFFTPRRTRVSPVSHPAGAGTKAVGVVLLLLLVLAAVLGFVRDALLHGGR